jgi:hypothetical protein
MFALRCPCGVEIAAATEDELVAAVEDHLATQHPRLVGAYDREDIVALSYRRPAPPTKTGN